MAAGDTIFELDFADLASDTEGADETGFSDTAYAAGSTPCGMTFTAPTSGTVLVFWHARVESNTASVRVLVSCEVREGAVVGSGTERAAASDSAALETSSSSSGGSDTRMASAMFRVVSGLTAGDTYNVRTMHKLTGAGTGDVFDRSVVVLAAP